MSFKKDEIVIIKYPKFLDGNNIWKIDFVTSELAFLTNLTNGFPNDTIFQFLRYPTASELAKYRINANHDKHP